MKQDVVGGTVGGIVFGSLKAVMLWSNVSDVVLSAALGALVGLIVTELFKYFKKQVLKWYGKTFKDRS